MKLWTVIFEISPVLSLTQRNVGAETKEQAVEVGLGHLLASDFMRSLRGIDGVPSVIQKITAEEVSA